MPSLINKNNILHTFWASLTIVVLTSQDEYMKVLSLITANQAERITNTLYEKYLTRNDLYERHHGTILQDICLIQLNGEDGACLETGTKVKVLHLDLSSMRMLIKSGNSSGWVASSFVQQEVLINTLF